jgi:peptidoglycan-associated lipoprotein
MVIVLTGCAKKIPPPAPPPPPPPPPPPAPAPPPRALTEDEIFAAKTLAQLNAERPLGDIAFDYDMSTLRDDARATLQRNADYMRRWPSIRVTTEGHADARGTNEYNLSLGERRAASVKDYLVSLGIAADRMLAISKGEEEPLCMEMTEACWAMNRRGHFIITAK